MNTETETVLNGMLAVCKLGSDLQLTPTVHRLNKPALWHLY